jgi:hypothetical protein
MLKLHYHQRKRITKTFVHRTSAVRKLNFFYLKKEDKLGMSHLVVDKVGEDSALFLHFEYFGLIEQRTMVAEHLLLHTKLRLHSPLQRRGFFTYQYTDNIEGIEH